MSYMDASQLYERTVIDNLNNGSIDSILDIYSSTTTDCIVVNFDSNKVGEQPNQTNENDHI